MVDANLLLYAAHVASPWHPRAKRWLDERLGGVSRVALPWSALGGFLRLATNGRVYDRPLDAEAAWSQVENWLATEAAWIPTPGPRHAELLGALVTRHRVTGKLVPDAMLAALALEHGLIVCSADSDFARFPEIRWVDPLA